MIKLRTFVALPLLGALFVPQTALAQAAPSVRPAPIPGLRVQRGPRVAAPVRSAVTNAAQGSSSATSPQGGPGASSGPAANHQGPATMSMNDVRQQPEMTKPPNFMVDFTLEDADLTELITMISTLTGKRFIFNAKVRNIKVNVYAPKNQKISVAEAYQTFLSILEANGLTIVPQGKFLKIVDSGGIVTQTTPLYGHGQPVPSEDRYVTRLYRLSHIGADEAAALLGKFKTKDADITVHGPGNLLIITDTAANIRRMLQLVEEIDVGGVGEQIWVEPIHYAAATEIAQKLTDTFEVKGAAPAPKGAPAQAAEGGITKIITEERTNSLIIVATERAYLRMLELIRRLDVPQSGEGEIHVLPLQHAMAEELAQTLNQILGGSGSMGAAPTPRGRSGGQAAAAQAAGGTEAVFEGSVRVTADKATNSLVVTSSMRDYASLRNVIDQLDMPRRQVFIEAVIMDMSVDHSTKLGLSYHGGAAPNLGGGSNSTMYGGLYPLKTILLPSPDDLQGLALGVRGPGLEGSTNLLGTGLSIPAFGVMLNALSTSGDANVLATPHIIATDNVPAEINVGENIPLQTNLGGMGSLPGLANGAGAAAGMAGLAGLAGLGGYGGYSVPRQDVGTKIKVVPHINDSDEVRLEITEEISEQGATSGTLGVVSITKRNAQTTVVVKDQQTVVIGGLMRDAVTTSQDKVPVLGDIPVLGALFRQSRKGTRKTNLLLILTPYVIRDQNDLKSIFERKMQERQEFLDRYFVFSDQKRYEPPRDFSRTNGLVEDIRQAFFKIEEKRRLEDESRPRETKTHEPSQPIEFPMQSGSSGGSGPAPMMPVPIMPMMPGVPGMAPNQPPPAPAPEARKAPLQINGPLRSLNVSRVED